MMSLVTSVRPASAARILASVAVSTAEVESSKISTCLLYTSRCV